jgi:phospholipid/cholesterol/gamma-HCH transport system substrate-binding protein
VTDDSLFVETKELATNLNSILKKVEKGEGTLGKLVMDDTLYQEATEALRKLGKTADTAEDLAPLSTVLSIGSVLF